MGSTSIVLLAETEARALTERIRQSTHELSGLLLQAHEGEAWRALGYESWTAYIDGEFDFNRSRSYQLLDHGRVLRLLESPEVSTSGRRASVGDVTERDARAVRSAAQGRAIEEMPRDEVEQVIQERREAPRPEPIQRVRNGGDSFPTDTYDSGEAIYQCRHCQRTGTLEQMARCLVPVRNSRDEYESA